MIAPNRDISTVIAILNPYLKAVTRSLILKDVEKECVLTVLLMMWSTKSKANMGPKSSISLSTHALSVKRNTIERGRRDIAHPCGAFVVSS